ncbi:MAG: thioredoxin domain-containing protein, partial [Candidatus Brocadiaceae bacterium]
MTGNGDQRGTAPPNRLIHCSSPYLRRHARNPVEWYPWCEEAVQRASGEDTPILLSIGYDACHWCHVMARECFEDPDIARVMNENFVCIKVDREERPDLDRLYMRAVQLLSGSGGWPLTVFLTPDLVPFYGGTYFPPEDREGMPAFPRVLRAVRRTYDERRAEVDSTTTRVAEVIEASVALPESRTPVSEEMLARALRSVVNAFNMRSGGFGRGAQFPQAPLLDWLLRLWHARGDDRPRLMLETTLDHMAAGGIFDQLGGGFHRYSVDSAWRVPHFEKMLYDNAQLTGLYADASRAFGRDDYLSIAARTADYVLGELRGEEGGFYSAQDADSPGGEGAYYLWTYRQVVDCLGAEEGSVVARHLGVTEQGNLEDGRNVLYQAAPLDRLQDLDEAEARRIVEGGLRQLLDRRRERVPPATDRMILADWNGLMISGLAKLARAHPAQEESCVEAARRAAAFVWMNLRREDRLHHSLCEGDLGMPAFLSDHAMLAAAFLDLYETTFESRWLRRAWELGSTIYGEFWDGDHGSFRESGTGGEELFARPIELA